jgi:hypothetical protein
MSLPFGSLKPEYGPRDLTDAFVGDRGVAEVLDADRDAVGLDPWSCGLRGRGTSSVGSDDKTVG